MSNTCVELDFPDNSDSSDEFQFDSMMQEDDLLMDEIYLQN